jgi:glucose-1-phosphate thymidylyltransferase
MIYYPLSVLMLGGIREILIISTPKDLRSSAHCLGTARPGFEHRARSRRSRRNRPSLSIGDSFIADNGVALILGDNIFMANSTRELSQPGRGDYFCLPGHRS